ncbi:MAG: argininosuccinate synthase, partial [Firmicutes bacterium]|nr:argininosuccinate synthase [Bacillota bacterium]
LVYDGLWFSALREALDAFVDAVMAPVTGTVRMKLYKGNCTPAGVRSPYSLYDPELATFGPDRVYNQADATGFINLFGLPLRVRAAVLRRAAAEGERRDAEKKTVAWAR